MTDEADKPSPVPSDDIQVLGPSWEEIARPGFAGASLRYQLRIRFERDVDWSRVLPPIAQAYQAAGATSSVTVARSPWSPAGSRWAVRNQE